MRTAEKKKLDRSRLDQLLTPYFNQNKYIESFRMQQISSDTGIPKESISDWYDEQIKQLWKVAEQRMLKRFNEQICFNVKEFVDLVVETGLDFYEIKGWYAGIVARIDNFYRTCPSPNTEDFTRESRETGVRVKIIRDWFVIKERGLLSILESTRRQVLKKTEKLIEKRACPLPFSETLTAVQCEVLEAFQLRNSQPSVSVMKSIAGLIKSCLPTVEEWFSKNRETRAMDVSGGNFEIAKREIEAGTFTLREGDVAGNFHDPRFTRQEVNFLEEFFFNDPLPNKVMTVWMCDKLKCNYKKVVNWFLKMKYKIRDALKEEENSARTDCGSSGASSSASRTNSSLNPGTSR